MKEYSVRNQEESKIRIFKSACFLFTFILLAFIANIQAQDLNRINALKTQTNLIYGSDDKLINGPIYLPEHYNAMGSPFFFSDVWTTDLLFIKGKEYSPEEIKYNIAKDRVVLHAGLNTNDRVMILLNNPVVDSFYIMNHFFINISHVLNKDTNLGFYELVYRNEYRFLVKHHKEFLKDYSEDMPHGKYTNDITSYYIFSNGILTSIPNQRSLLRFFKPYKKEIRKFIKSKKIKFRKANTIELYTLMDYITKLTTANE